MASKAIGSFHARASLDATEFDEGAHQMAASLNQAARDIDNAWGIIDSRAVKSARASAKVFEKSGLGPIYSIEDKSIDSSINKINRAASSVMSLNKGQEAGSKMASRYGLIMQQVGYQVQDFSVQAAAGQNKLVAFSQQSSQLLGFFGPYGAIAGAAISTGVLAYRLSSVGDEVQRAKEKADELEKKMRETAKAAQDAASAFSEAMGEYTKGVSVNAPALDAISQSDYEKQVAARRKDEARMMDESRLLESQASVALMRSRDDRKTEEERNTLYQDYVSLLNKSAGALAGAAIYQNIINALTERRNATVSRSQDIQQQINEAEKKSLKERTDSFDEIYEQAARDLAIRTKEAEAIRDQINPLRARIREQERLNELVEKGNLKPEELNAFYRARADKTVLGLQSRIPQALQVNTGTSALGGTFGSGPANQIIDIQKGILDGIRQLVRMEMLAGAN